MIVDLIFSLFGLIIALILLLIFAVIVVAVVVFVGYVKEEICEEQDKGFFHKVADKIEMF